MPSDLEIREQRLKNIRDIIKSIKDDSDEQLEIMKEQLDIVGQTAKDYDIIIKKVEIEKKLLKERLKYLELDESKVKDKIISLKIILDNDARRNRYTYENIEKMDEELELLENIISMKDDELNIAKEMVKLRVDQLKADSTRASGLKAADVLGSRVASTFAGLTGVSSNWEESIVGAFVAASKKGVTFSEMLENIGEHMKETFTLSNVLGSMYEKLQEITVAYGLAMADLALEQNNAISSFRKSAVGAKEFDDVLLDSHLNVRTLGVDMQETLSSLKALHEQMADFTSLSAKSQQEIVEFTAVIQEFGVSATDTAANFQVLTQSLSFSTENALKVTRELIASAKALNIPFQQMISDFKSASSELAKYGKGAVIEFQKLAAVAKGTGIEMNALLGITKQFDTFEGAANAAGKLNSLLGGTVNAVQLLNATETERILILNKSLSIQGKNWESLGRFEKKAIAAAMGITDMAAASALLNANPLELERLISESESASVTQRELESLLQDSLSVLDKLEALAKSLVVSIYPLVDIFSEFLDVLVDLRKEYSTGFSVVGTAFIVLVGGISLALGTVVASLILYNIALSSAAAITTIAAIASGGLSAGLTASAVSATGATAALAALTPLLTAIGTPPIIGGAAVIASIALSFGLMAAGAGALALSLTGIIAEMIIMMVLIQKFPSIITDFAKNLLILGVTIIGFTVLMSSIALIAPVAFFAMSLIGAGAIILGEGMLLLGASTIAFGLGMKLMFQSIDKLPLAAVAFKGLAKEMAGWHLVLAAMSPALIVFGIALLPLGLGMLSLGLGMKFIGEQADNMVSILASFASMTIVIAMLSGLMFSASIPALAFGLALIPLGIGLALMGVGLMSMSKGLSMMKGDLTTLVKLGLALSVFSGFMMIVGVFAPLLVGAALGISTLGLGIMIVATGIDMLANSMKRLGNSAGPTLINIAEGMVAMVNSMSDMNLKDLVLFSYVTGGISSLAESTTKLTPEKVALAKDLVNTSARHTELMNRNDNDSLTDLVSAVGNLNTASKRPPATQSGNRREVVLKINEREFARAVIDIINGSQRLGLE